MTYWGKYGDLSAVEAAKASLIEIAETISVDYFYKIDSPGLPPSEWYDLMRLHRMVEGLQQVLWLNKVSEPYIWLPKLFDPKKHKILMVSKLKDELCKENQPKPIGAHIAPSMAKRG